MAEGKNLKADAQAAELARNVRSYNHAAPTGSEMAIASGVAEGPGLVYKRILSEVGAQLETTFQQLLREVVQDCDRTQQSVEQMQELDSQISGILKGIVVERGTSAVPAPGSSAGKATSW